MDTVLAYCETCQTEVEALGAYLGRDEDGDHQYELLTGNDWEASSHINDGHDLSVPQEG